MLYALLVTFALLSSPLECCGGGGFSMFRQPRYCAPVFSVSIEPPKVDVLKVLRIDQYSSSLRWSLAIIAPRPLSSVIAATLQADTHGNPQK